MRNNHSFCAGDSRRFHAATMVDNHVDCLLVQDNDELIGIITIWRAV